MPYKTFRLEVIDRAARSVEFRQEFDSDEASQLAAWKKIHQLGEARDAYDVLIFQIEEIPLDPAYGPARGEVD